MLKNIVLFAAIAVTLALVLPDVVQAYGAGYGYARVGPYGGVHYGAAGYRGGYGGYGYGGGYRGYGAAPYGGAFARTQAVFNTQAYGTPFPYAANYYAPSYYYYNPGYYYP